MSCVGLQKSECLPPECTYVDTDKRQYCRSTNNPLYSTQTPPKTRKIKLRIKRKETATEGTKKTPRVLDRQAIVSCKKEDSLREQLKLSNEDLKRYKKECDTEIYKYIAAYFTSSKPTIKELMFVLYNIYKHKKKLDINYILNFREFVLMFPRDTSTGNSNFRRQHVFEAICKYMLFKNYDSNYWGKNKEFYVALEEYTRGKKTKITENDLLNNDINDGSSAQSVDIFFKIANTQITKPPSIMCQKEQISSNTHDKDVYVLIQNKFYDQEKSSADKYDVTKIINRAKKLTDPKFENATTKLVLMVNSKNNLDKKISRTRNDDFSLVDEIFGLEELDAWFQNMMYDIYKSSSFSDFININSHKNDKPSLQLKFHQEFFIETTHKYLTDGDGNDENSVYKKFIWGAVPRSGKSYMIAGMIDKRRQNGVENDILIILGAKTETDQQFYNIFKDHDNFNDYAIVKVSDDKRYQEKESTRNIYITSQEKFKLNKDGYKYYEKLFKKKKIDIYFDEIHKGGSSERAQAILNFLITENFTIDLFVMVTATYAKPMKTYTYQLDTKEPIILKWSYEDQQIMKEISNDMKRKQLEDSKTIYNKGRNIQKEVIDDLFLKYRAKYGTDSLRILEEQYKTHPELVIIQPFIDVPQLNDYMHSKNDNTQENYNIHGNLFKLKCTSISDELSELRDPSKIFNDNSAVVDLLRFIGNIDENDTLSENCIYGKLKYKYNYDVLSTPHTELWFLPDKSLYDTPDKCKEYIDEKGLRAITDDVEGGAMEYDDVKMTDKIQKGLPNIEPLTRGIALNLLQNKFFRDMYCILIVHNQQIKYMKAGVDKTKKVFDTQCVKIHSEDKDNIKDKIKQFERDAFNNDKSLIILTGSMLRLGVSLPCADIAFNFDGVQSIDLNYQTMFRVLTERPGKKYGYYFDFFPDRAITFLYEYNEVYSNTADRPTSVSRLEELQSLLYVFNYNGLGITGTKETATQSLNLYTKLVEQLKLNETELKTRYIQNIKKRFVRLFSSLGDTTLLERFTEYQLQENIKVSKRNVVKEGKKKEALKTQQNTDKKEGRDNEDNDNDEDADEDGIIANREQIAEFFATYIPIISLFSLENNCGGDDSTFADCLDKMIADIQQKIDDTTTLGDYCRENCGSIDEPLACYMNLIMNYDKKTFLKSLMMLKSIFEDNAIKKDNTMKHIIDVINIIYTSIRDEMGRKTNLIMDMSADDIKSKIEEYLPVKEAEKNKFGEVFTPAALIHEILDKLPKSVWKDPSLKWLDPANGIGNFPMIAFEMLDAGLSSVDGFKDEAKRKKHIIENMLYMVELNPKNVAVSRKIFGKSANIYCGSFLEDGWQKAFGVEKFDVIMGNPPYNEGGVRAKTTINIKRNIKGEATTIWPIFVERSINSLLNKNSHLCFIHPASWISLKSKISDLLLSKQIEYIRYYNVINSLKLFKTSGEIPLTYYLLKNTNTKNDTKIYDNCLNKYIEFNIYINNFIPTEVISIFEKIYKYTKKYGNLTTKIVNPTLLSDLSTKNSKDTYPVISINNKEIQIKYSKTHNYTLKKPKLVFTNSTMGYPVLDKDGDLFNNGSDKYYIIADSLKELKQLQNFFYTNIVFYLINITRTRQKFLNNKLFEILPDITRFVNDINITDNYLIELFKLTKEEQMCLELYKKNGEGLLTKKQITTFKSYNHNTNIKTTSRSSSSSPPKTRRRGRSHSPYKKTHKKLRLKPTPNTV
jgi:hypothetical protein